MADKIVTLYNANNDRIFPSTKIEAISDAEGKTLGTLLDQRATTQDTSGINEALKNGWLILGEDQYGSTLPTAGQKGRIFFRVAGEVPAAEEASF
jgi:hypothetical protein